MGKPKVVAILLEHAGDVLDEMMSIRDESGMTGFMLACRWNKTEVVQTLIGSSIGKSDVYEGFILACQHQKKKIIDMILQNDEFRKHILAEEKQKGKAIINLNGKIELRQQIMNQNQEIVISFDAMQCKDQLDIEIKVESTYNKEEAEENDKFSKLQRGPFASHYQQPGKARSSVGELESMELVSKSQVKSILAQSATRK